MVALSLAFSSSSSGRGMRITILPFPRSTVVG